MLGFHTGAPITFYTSETVIITEGWLSPEYARPLFQQCGSIKLYESFAECVEDRRPESIFLRRHYALGDILMLLPVVRGMRRRWDFVKEVIIGTETRFSHQLGDLNGIQSEFCVVADTHLVTRWADLQFDLNSCLEVDHRGGWQSHEHRVRLYALALGLDLERGE